MLNKCYENQNKPHFHGKHIFNIPKEGSHCFCLSVITIDAAFQMGKNCYPQTFL